MKGFYHIWAWRPSWSCDLDFLYTHWSPLPIDASCKIWLWLAKRFQRRRSLRLWTDGRTDERTTDGRTDGQTPDHGHPISSPCEPNGSGELKIPKLPFLGKIFRFQGGVRTPPLDPRMPTISVLSKNIKTIKFFSIEIISVYLRGYVFVMYS